MNQIYKAVSYCIIGIAALVPGVSSAQCSCPGGDPIDSVVHTVSIVGLADPNTVVQLPKFNPATGTLACLRLRAQIYTTLEMDLYNREPFLVPDYFMNYYRITSVSGPPGGGISASSTWNKDYGPYSLEGNPGPLPDSTVHIGPDVVFNNLTLVRTTTNVVPYIGTGNVNFTYINTGSATMLQGSNNFRLDVQASTDVNFRLSYYFCPNAVLPSGMRNFSLVRSDRQVSLRWITDDEKISNRYTIQYSRDGVNFENLETRQAMTLGTASYDYRFTPPAGENGRVYFRIRQTNIQGRDFYSAVKSVSFSENGTIQTTVYPNPAKKQVMVQFESPQSGTLEIDLVNTIGQVLEHQKQRVSKAGSLPVSFERQHIRGLYWLRVRNTATGEQSVTRLTIE
jgi:hypothetical protein